jgi:hypothetical protein
MYQNLDMCLILIIRHLNFILEIKYFHSELIKTYALAVRILSYSNLIEKWQLCDLFWEYP